MRLKKLRLSGFKSFCDQTELEFLDNGITLIVGPNGCGKSNVVDAIRWVLGEQSPSYLRGQAMGDIIFAGSDSRKPVGRGEVTILFDNTDGRSPEKYRDYSEISVTRRLYRSGESEYLINKAPCRLMDIRELVMDTGIAGRSYSIIEQGRAEQFISASPAERRIFMEEAAGIVRFKTKRIAAERKLEQTTANLLRVQDLLGELKRQETQLRGQKEKAAQYGRLRGEVEALTARLARAKRRRAEQKVGELETSRQTLAQQAAEAGNLLTARQAELAALELEGTQQEARLQRERESLLALQREIQQEETQLLVERQNRTHNEEWIGQANQGMAEVGSRRTALEEEIRTTRETLELLERQQQNLAAEVEKLDALHATGEAARGQAEAEMQGLRDRLMECHTQLTGIANQQQFLRERLEEGRLRSAGLEQQTAENSGELEILHQNLATLRGLAATLREKTDTAQAEALALGKTLGAKSEQQTHQKDLLSQVERDALACESRLASLREIENSREDFDEKVRAVLAWAAGAPEVVEELGWLGPLADHLTVPENALAGAGDFLAPYLELIVIREMNRLPLAQQRLREAGFGGVRLVALDAFSGATPAPSPNLGELVALDGELTPLGPGLFGRVALHPAGPVPVPLPTVGSGELLAEDGTFYVGPQNVVTLGVATAHGAGLLRRRAEISGLETRLEELSRTRDGMETRLAALAVEHDRLVAARAELENARERDTLALSQKEQELAHAEREQQRLTQAAENLRMAAERLAEEHETFSAQQTTLAADAERWETDRATLEEAIKAAAGRNAQATRKAAELTRDFMEKKVEHQKVASREENFTARLQQLEQDQHTLQERARGSEQELANQQAAGKAIQQRIEALTAGLEARQQRFGLAQQALQELARGYDLQESGVRAAAAGLTEQRQKVERAQQQLHEVELALAGERARLAQWAQTPAEPEGSPLLEKVEELEPIDEARLEENIAAAQQRLGRMEGVNLAAAEEYDALTARLEFLETQQGDLETAMADLRESIRRMNQETRRRFKETFDLVNEKFQTVFPLVFNGGAGRLVLTDTEDLLLAGVEIEAQPPGKKLQSMSLLSGGEKSLTAIALIFSFFLIKPSPFCLLDEVDAPLDDANVGRFARMVQNMTDQSQFIIITHNKKTMEIGDLLYGVTMEEAGVSKVVSVKLSA